MCRKSLRVNEVTFLFKFSLSAVEDCYLHALRY